jgi:CRP/FNR family transcriptional regulator, cyclic AMP receptor protein
MALKDRFLGSDGNRALYGCLLAAKLVQGNGKLAEALIAAGEVLGIPSGQTIIEQGGDDNDLYLVIAGTSEILVNGRVVARRGPGDHMGEMAAIEPSQKRAATVVSTSDMVLLKISEPSFHVIAQENPSIYRDIARELSRRLLQRNSLIGTYRERVRVFIISSVESLQIARYIQNAFEHDPFTVTIWTDGVFKISSYTLQSLEDELDQSDFAIAIAHGDDLTAVRGMQWPTPRDNVIFELGLFMGRLGKTRAILMEPREEKVKLPSDLTGITTVSYHFRGDKDSAESLGPACNKLRDHIKSLGPNNG